MGLAMPVTHLHQVATQDQRRAFLKGPNIMFYYICRKKMATRVLKRKEDWERKEGPKCPLFEIPFWS